MEPRLRWGQIKPSQPPRRVARGARSSRHGGAKPTCHSHGVALDGEGIFRGDRRLYHRGTDDYTEAVARGATRPIAAPPRSSKS